MRFPRTLSLLPLTVFVILLTSLADADFQAGKDAYYRGDYEMAFKEWQPLAEQGDAKAQGLLGFMYFKGQGVSQDAVQAHMWNNLSAAQGHNHSLTLRDSFAREMTQGQIAEAQRLASQWKPKTGSASALQPDLNETHEQVDWTQQLFDSIYWDKNELIVDIDQVKLSLANGANPNWISGETKRDMEKSFREVLGLPSLELSILNNFVMKISFLSGKRPMSEKDSLLVSLGTEAVRLLFQNGAKLQSCDRAILFWPVANGPYEMVKLLLENGADAKSWPYREIGTDYFLDPIEQAAASGHDQIVDLLANYGARKPNEKDIVQLEFIETAGAGTTDELKKLFNKGVRINEKNPNGETALIKALQIPWWWITYEKIEFLLASGADPNREARVGGTVIPPLHYAVAHSGFLYSLKSKSQITEYPEEILKLLIVGGAFISGRNREDKTPLHIAAEFNSVFAAQLLLDLGAKVKPKDSSGKTPFDYAESQEMILLLKKHGVTE